MISTSNISLRFGKKALFEDVNIKFVQVTATDLLVLTVPENQHF